MSQTKALGLCTIECPQKEREADLMPCVCLQQQQWWCYRWQYVLAYVWGVSREVMPLPVSHSLNLHSVELDQNQRDGGCHRDRRVCLKGRHLCGCMKQNEGHRVLVEAGA